MGKVTHCFAPIGCVAIKVRSGSIKVGDKLLFVKGDPPEDRDDKEFFDCPPDEAGQKTNWHKSCHLVESIQIDGKDMSSVEAGVECAIKITTPGQSLPPSNASVHLLKQGSKTTREAKPYFS